MLELEELSDIAFQKYIKTEDNFHGNSDGNLVRCRASFTTDKERYEDYERARFFIAGNDDFALELCLKCDSIGDFVELKKKFFDNIPIPITIKWLEEQGFCEW